MIPRVYTWCALALIVFAVAVCGKAGKQETIPYKLETASSADVSPRDLFERARALRNPEEKLALYRQIVTEHPESNLAEASQFMIGFVYVEELGDTVSAIKELHALTEKWPEGEWRDDAEALIKDLEG
jgi:hypothetical protein